MTPRRVHWNGALQPADALVIPCNDLGFLAGDGVFETIWVTDSAPVFLPAHVQRLLRGLEQLRIPLPCMPEALPVWVRQLIAAQPEIAPSARLRITVTAGAAESGGRRVRPANVLITLDPWTPLPPATYERGVRVDLSAHRRAPHPLQAIKSTSYASSRWQRREARDSTTFDVVQSNINGCMAEGSFTNVFVVDGAGTLRTPAAADGCLPGVTRAAVLELARAAGVACREGAVPVAALWAEPEVFLTGSLCGIVPVCQVDEAVREPAAPGPVTQRLMAVYAARTRQERQQHSIGAANDG